MQKRRKIDKQKEGTKMAKEAKTNAMRMLDRKKVSYETLSYECDEFIDGIHSADITGAPYEQSFKTLVMEGKSGAYYVFVVPIEKEVNRKEAAKASTTTLKFSNGSLRLMTLILSSISGKEASRFRRM